MKNLEMKNNIGGIVKISSNCDSNNGSILKGISQLNLYSFALDKPPRHKKNKKNVELYFIAK